jgi:hypothetical protein
MKVKDPRFLIELKKLAFIFFYMFIAFYYSKALNVVSINLFIAFRRMSAHKKPKLAHSDLNIEVSLDEVLKQSVHLLVNLINEEAVSRKTRTFWEVYLQILRQSFCTKSTVEFWGDHLRRMLKFLEMEPKVQSLFLALFTSRFTWHRQSQIRYLFVLEIKIIFYILVIVS